MSGTFLPEDDSTCGTFTPVGRCVSGGSGGMTVGDPVVGGGANRVLYEDAAQNLATSANFTFAGNVLSVLGAYELRSDPTAPISGAGNVRLRSNAGVLQASQNGGAYAAIGGMAIGGAVAGAANGEALFVLGGVLAQDPDFYWYDAATWVTAELNLGGGTQTASLYVDGFLGGNGIQGLFASGTSINISSSNYNLIAGGSDLNITSTFDVVVTADLFQATIATSFSVDAASMNLDATGGAIAVTADSWAAILTSWSTATGNTQASADTSGWVIAKSDVSTNTVVDVFTLRRTSTVGANGIGMGLAYYLMNDSSTTILAARESVYYTDASSTNEDSAIDFSSLQNGVFLTQAALGGALRGLHVPSGGRVSIGTTTTSLWFVNISSNIAVYQTNSTTNGHSFRASASTSGARTLFHALAPANTGQTAGTDIPSVHFNLSATRTWATGAIAEQHEFQIDAPTYAFVGASVVTTAATFYVSGAPIAGSNATITNSFVLWTGGGRVRLDGIDVALGGGAAPTLGTIGGSGPTVAAQSKWLEITVGGTRNWVPAWV